MSYLKFDKNIIINLEQSLTKEVLRTNKSGGYSYSTIVDCNTRKYHGLFVIPLPELDGENHVLMSSLDVTVIQHGAEFNLGLHKYPGNNYSPKGHKYIRHYECDSVPVTTYRVGGVILSRELLFVSHENRLLIKYTLLDAHSPTVLRFRPYLAFRNTNALCRENNAINKNYEVIENGVKMCLYPGYPSVHMQFSHKNEFVFEPDWYRNIEYIKEQERGYDYQEDLYVPGYFEAPIKQGDNLFFSVGTTPISPRNIRILFHREAETRTPRNSFTNTLKNAAYQFYNKKEDKQRYILAGYPWFKCRARDMFISLPGCTLATKNLNHFEAIMKTGEKALLNFINGHPLDCEITEIDAPDVLLWYIWSIQEYAGNQGIENCCEKYGNNVFKAMDFIHNQRHENLFLHENGLLYTYGKDRPVSWMNSTFHEKPLIPRSGYLVEFNALWYNALCFSAELAKVKGDTKRAKTYATEAEKTAQSFVDVFRNIHGYLFDYVNGDPPDWSVRPNQIFAVSLEYSPLNRIQKKNVLDFVTKELLTPRGLRTLSPKSAGYNSVFEGNEEQRTWSYHQGTAWPWLIGPYLEGYLKVYQASGINFAQRIIYGFEEELSERAIGTISEFFDGNPPYRGRGAVSYAMNVAEIMRIQRKIKNMQNNTEEE